MDNESNIRTIYFKRQMLGQWRRDDGESKTHVNEKAMNREIQKLRADGWLMKIEGVSFVRGVRMTKP